MPELSRKAKTGAAREVGQALLEFSLVLLLLLLLMFAIVDFSRLFFAYATMANGVREGARYGIIHPGQDTAIINRARDMMLVIGGEANVTVEYPGRDDGTELGCTTPYFCRIRVLADSDLDVWTPILPAVRIEAQATMHFE